MGADVNIEVSDDMVINNIDERIEAIGRDLEAQLTDAGAYIRANWSDAVRLPDAESDDDVAQWAQQITAEGIMTPQELSEYDAWLRCKAIEQALEAD